MKFIIFLIFIGFQINSPVSAFALNFQDSCCKETPEDLASADGYGPSIVEEPATETNSNCCDQCPEKGRCCSSNQFSPGAFTREDDLSIKAISYAIFFLDEIPVLSSGGFELIKPPLA